MSQKTLIMSLLSPILDTGLSEAGRALLRRLKAAGSPTTGQDAQAFAQLLDGGDVPQKYRNAMCEWLGYLPIGGYPLTRIKGGGELDEREEDIGRGDSLSERPSTGRLRTRRPLSVVREEKKAKQEAGRKAHGLKGRRSNNPRGRPRLEINFARLPAGEWVDVSTASLLLGVDVRTLRARIQKRALPDSIETIRKPYLLRRKLL